MLNELASNASRAKCVFYCSVLFLSLLVCSSSVFAETRNSTLDRFITISDIHFDPFITCEKTTPCPIIETLRAAPVDTWNSILATSDTSTTKLHQDTNYELLQAMSNELQNRVKLEKPKFVLVLGDFLGHDYQEKYEVYAADKSEASYQQFVKKTFEFLTLELNRTFPKLNVYPVIGNNDSYESDYSVVPNGAFLKDISNIWATLIKDPFNKVAVEQALPLGGYYAVNIHNVPHLKLIVLNTVIFSKKIAAPGPLIDQAAQQQLIWLHQTLQAAQAKNQKVMIAMHIPAGIDVYSTLKHQFVVTEFLQDEYTQQLQQEFQMFAANIVGIFPGHLHMDWFQRLTAPTATTLPISGTPGMSPLFGNPPAYKIFRYSPQTLALQDFTTYSYALDGTHQWHKEYDFMATYHPTCLNCRITEGMNAVNRSGTAAEDYKRYYALGGKQPIDTYWSPYYWCHLTGALSWKDYQGCVQAGNR